MANFCLTKQAKENLLKAVDKDEITPEILMGFGNSASRREFLKKYVGEEASSIFNAQIEKSLLKKNQELSLINTIKSATGIKPEIKRDIISRIRKMEGILAPAKEKGFYQDAIKSSLKIEPTMEEARQISELSRKVSELEGMTDKAKSDVELGRAKMSLMDYINELGGKKASLATEIANLPRAFMTSLDLSAPLNQGWGMVSRKQFYTSLYPMLKAAVSKDNYLDIQASIITDPMYETAQKAGLRLTSLGNKLEQREESFMTTLLDKVPLVSGSQRAYTAFLNKLRLDVFKDVVNKAEIAGEDVNLGSQTTKDLASMVNDFTGGAKVGKIEGAVPELNALFFSPRKIKSTIGILNPANYLDPKISKSARKERLRNLIGSLSLSAAIIAIYSILTGKKQETDPTSSDFGKIRSGNTRLDVSGGNATYANLLSRIILGRIKSSSGYSTPLGGGYGQKSAFDLIAQAIRYKLSPNASLLVDIITGENALGEKKTIQQSVIDRMKPIYLDSLYELMKSDTEGKIELALGGLFGAGLSTYSYKSDWNESTSQELKQFKSKVGEAKFKKANEDFDRVYEWWLNDTMKKESYRRLSDDEKKSLQTKAKDKIKEMIFTANDFKPSKTVNKQKTEELKKLLP